MLTHVISSYFTIEIYTMRSSITLSTNCLLLTLLNRFSNYIKFFLLSYIKSNKETFSAFYIVSTFLHTVFIKINTYHFLIKACIKLATLGLQISFFYMYKVHLVYLAIQRLAVLISDSTKYLSFFYVNLLSYRPRYAARHLRKKILKELNFFKLCTSELLIKHILYIIYLLKFFNI